MNPKNCRYEVWSRTLYQKRQVNVRFLCKTLKNQGKRNFNL